MPDIIPPKECWEITNLTDFPLNMYLPPVPRIRPRGTINLLNYVSADAVASSEAYRNYLNSAPPKISSLGYLHTHIEFSLLTHTHTGLSLLTGGSTSNADILHTHDSLAKTTEVVKLIDEATEFILGNISTVGHDHVHNDLDGLNDGDYIHLTASEYLNFTTLTNDSNADSLHTHAGVGGGVHNDLTGLDGGAVGEYYHFTMSQHDTLTDGSNADALHVHSGTGGTSIHNDLTGLQGGDPSNDEFYHLSISQATDLADDAFLFRDGHLPMTGNLDLGNNDITNVDVIDFQLGNPSVGNPPHKEGRIFYDNVRRGFSVYVDDSEVKGDLLEETWIKVRNETGQTIPNGAVVGVSGAVGGRSLIELSKADNPETANSIIGLTTHIMENGEDGYVTIFGAIHDVDTSLSSEGDILYLSPDVAGGYTSIRPTYPQLNIQIGHVIVSDPTEGVISVNITGQVSDIINNITNGSITQTINFTIDSDGSTITGTLDVGNIQDPSNPPDHLTLDFSDGFSILSLDPLPTIILSPGTDSNPITNRIYIPIDTKVLTITTGDWPDDEEHVKICTAILRSAATTKTDSALGNRNWNDHIAGSEHNGHLLHISERLRMEHAKWRSGTALSVTGSGTTNIDLAVTSGVVAQLHVQTFPAIDMAAGEDIHIVNDSVNPYLTTNDLVADVTLDALGNTINNNKYFNLTIWGVQNRTGHPSHLMCNLPIGTYSGPSAAIADSQRYDVFTIPSTPNFVGIGFLIGRLTFQKKGANWDLINELDLRGTIPGNAAGSSASLALTSFADSSFNIFNTTDNTKILDFDVSSVSTGTTRTITMVDRDLDLSNPIFDNVTIYSKLYFGENLNSSIYFDGTDLNITLNNPSQEGLIRITDDLFVAGKMYSNNASLEIRDDGMFFVDSNGVEHEVVFKDDICSV